MGESQGYMPQPDRLDWGTPQEVFNMANDRFGLFNVDLAASSSNKKCELFFSEENSALEGDWDLSGFTGWLNPPYGRMLKPFSEQVVKQLEKGNIKRVVMLVPCRTETKWFLTLIPYASHVLFFKGRLRFEGATSSAPFSSCLIVLEKQPMNKCVEFGVSV